MDINEIKKLCQKKKENEVPYAWFVTRKASIYITWALCKTNITPNQVTVLSIIAGAAGGLLYSINNYWAWILGAVLQQIWYLLDCVDGEVARLKKQYSDEGIFLDLMGHYIVNFSFAVGFFIGMYRMYKLPIIIICGILYIVFSTLMRLINTVGYHAYCYKFIGKNDVSAIPSQQITSFNKNSGQSKVYKNDLEYIIKETGVFTDITVFTLVFISVILDVLLESAGVVGFWYSFKGYLIIAYSTLSTFVFLKRFYSIVSNKKVTEWINQ